MGRSSSECPLDQCAGTCSALDRTCERSSIYMACEKVQLAELAETERPLDQKGLFVQGSPGRSVMCDKEIQPPYLLMENN